MGLVHDRVIIGLPRQHSGKESACQCRRHNRCSIVDVHNRVLCLSQKEYEMGTHSSILAWKFHGQRDLLDFLCTLIFPSSG